MHKLKIYIVSSICILSLIACKDKSKELPSTGIFLGNISNDKAQYAIVKNSRLLYPSESESKFKIQKDEIFLDNNKYTKLNTNNVSKNFDSIEISYNTDNYESLGIKEFDAKIYQSSIVFYDVENNVTKEVKLDYDFKKWLNFSLNKRKMDLKNIDKNNKFIVCAIIYNGKQAKTIYTNALNGNNNDLSLFMTILHTYLSINKNQGIEVSKKNIFKSQDSLNVFIDKNNIGIKRVPLPPLESK
ncbi:hypothetical protein [Chryseobacterium sp.]|uniref:hypothetical protein n=1 Tax=Chryseobacterium sp. TaxID=1871047 RepID=UPI0035B29215